MINVCFRFDDPSPTSDHELERRILEIFARHVVPLCVAVIPFTRRGGDVVALSRECAGHLLDALHAGRIEVAQHGHTHLPRGIDRRGAQSEFAGLPVAQQSRLIAEGSEWLASVFGSTARGFVPPWNTYDRGTAQALDQAGFEFLSAGEDVIRFGRLAVVPRTCTLRDARTTVERATDFELLAPLVVVVFHPDDFREFKLPPAPDEPPPFTDLDELDALLRWLRGLESVRVQALGAIAASVRRGQPLRATSELRLPWRIRKELPPLLVQSGEWSAVAGAILGTLRSRRPNN